MRSTSSRETVQGAVPAAWVAERAVSVADAEALTEAAQSAAEVVVALSVV